MSHNLLIPWPGRMFSKNRVLSEHWRSNADNVSSWRELGYYAAYQAKLPKPFGGEVRVTSRWHTSSRSSRLPDVGGWSPALEAVLDGLTDYGCWPDDSPEFVCEKRYIRPVRGGMQGLEVLLEEPLSWSSLREGEVEG